MNNEVMKNYVSVLFDDAEAVESSTDNLSKINMLTAMSVKHVSEQLHKQLDCDSPKVSLDVENSVLRLNAKAALDVLEAMELLFNTVESSINSLQEISDEITGVANEIDDSLLQPEPTIPKETQDACEEFAKILAKLTTRGQAELMDCVYRYVDSCKTFKSIDPATEQEEPPCTT